MHAQHDTERKANQHDRLLRTTRIGRCRNAPVGRHAAAYQAAIGHVGIQVHPTGGSRE